jgi:hypothetical protein
MNLTIAQRKTRLIGAILVERGLVTPDQLEAALQLQAERGGLLGEIVAEEFGVPRVELSQVLADQWAELEAEQTEDSPPPALRQEPRIATAGAGTEAPLRMGDALIQLGLTSREEIDAALEVQKQTGERLGEILVGREVISRLELASALSEHWSSLAKLRSPGEEIEPVDAPHSSDGSRLEDTVAAREQELAAQIEQLASQLQELSSSATTDRLAEQLEALSNDHRHGATALHQLETELAALRDHTQTQLDTIAAATEALAARFDSPAAAAILTGLEDRLSRVEDRVYDDLRLEEAIERALDRRLAQLVIQIPTRPEARSSTSRQEAAGFGDLEECNDAMLPRLDAPIDPGYGFSDVDFEADADRAYESTDPIAEESWRKRKKRKNPGRAGEDTAMSEKKRKPSKHKTAKKGKKAEKQAKSKGRRSDR